MSKRQSQSIRRKLWIRKIAGTLLLLVSIPTLRKANGTETQQIQIPDGLDWEPVDIEGIHGEWLSPPGAPTDAVIIHFHGGGGVLGLNNSVRSMVGYLALESNLRALLPDYRLAPEHPYPAGLDDCLSTYRWLLFRGYAPQRIVMAGDSEGGHIMLSALLRLRDAGLPLPAAAIGISPNTDPTCSGESMRFNALRDAVLSPIFARRMMHHYVGGHSLDDPYLSPLIADLHNFPPILIQAGADEILLDDSRHFADCARTAGVDLTLEIWPNMWHCWHYWVPELPEANQAIEHIARYLHSLKVNPSPTRQQVA
ncbi:MAG TPA: alpha/beta hydrolase [Anaerolineaceae bacterium]|nr:alpha/beta hydrolase [Anaerolineaceae bacterium]